MKLSPIQSQYKNIASWWYSNKLLGDYDSMQHMNFKVKEGRYKILDYVVALSYFYLYTIMPS